MGKTLRGLGVKPKDLEEKHVSFWIFGLHSRRVNSEQPPMGKSASLIAGRSVLWPHGTGRILTYCDLFFSIKQLGQFDHDLTVLSH